MTDYYNGGLVQVGDKQWVASLLVVSVEPTRNGGSEIKYKSGGYSNSTTTIKSEWAPATVAAALNAATRPLAEAGLNLRIA